MLMPVLHSAKNDVKNTQDKNIYEQHVIIFSQYDWHFKKSSELVLTDIFPSPI